LAAVIGALILPLAGGNIEHAVALAGALALLSGTFCLLIGLFRLGLIADFLSKPIRIGFLNAIACTVIIGQLPKLLGFSVLPGTVLNKIAQIGQALTHGRVHTLAFIVGFFSLTIILALKHYRPTWPGILFVVVLATALSTGFGWAESAQLAVVGSLPQGLPNFQVPMITFAELTQLLPGAAMIALLSFADTSVLSRSLAQRSGQTVRQNQEIIAIGVANMVTGMFQGFSVSSSASRTPVAEAAGAQTQITGVIAALMVALMLVLAPNLVRDLPSAALAAVVIAACWSFVDVRGMLQLYRLRRMEFVLSLISFLGVALIGVIEGIVIAIVLALLVLIWNAWHPYFAVLTRVNGVKGYHDVSRHPEGKFVPGLVLFRWDAQLFFANAEIFRTALQLAISTATSPTRRVVVVSDAITDIDITAADVLTVLHAELKARGIELFFAGLKGQVKDRLRHYGALKVLGEDIFAPTAGVAVNGYRKTYQLAWKDWDEL
jgi:MFS superfamily sulfate permease-like transporter